MAYRSFNLFDSAARTTHASSGEIVVQNREVGLRVDINITAFSGTSITFKLEFYEYTSGTWQQLLASSALSSTGVTTLHVDPRIAASANAVGQAILPKRIRLTPSGTITSVTYGAVATLSA